MKTKHPSNRAERIKIKTIKDGRDDTKVSKKKKDLHDNASPVYKLLKEREINLDDSPNKGKNNDV